jgi:glycosyltransferase involved in cell wall biosynthesis
MAQPKKIRILQGIRQGKIGGGEIYLMGLIDNLDKSRYEPVVLSFTDGPMVDHLKKQGIETHVIHTEKPFDIRIWKKVKKFIEEKDIDIIHAHGTRANSNLFWAAKKLKLPIIYTCHGWSFHVDQNPVVKKVRILSEEYLTSKMDVNICCSASSRDTGKKYFRNYDAKVIYNSVDAKKFNPYGQYKDIRKELGIAKDEIVIVSVARLTLQKQPLLLIRAFSEVSKKVPNARLLLVGGGELQDKVDALIASLNLGDRIICQSFRQDVPDVLAASDIFVLPSLWEGNPIALQEAMSMGKAVIGSHVDGTREIIQHKENGILIELENMEQQLVQELVTLCNDPSLRKSLQQQAINSIYGKYTVENLARQNEEVYEQLILQN